MLRKIEIELTKPIQESVVQPENPKKIFSAEDGIQFSKTLIEFFKHKAKLHSVSESKISVAQLKKVFLLGAENISNDQTKGFNGVAFVNMYLRSGQNYQFQNDWSPNEEDMATTKIELASYALDKDFEEEDLYFKEDEPISVGFTIRNLL